MKINVKIDKSLNQPEITISAQTEREAERIREIVFEANKIRQKKIEAMDGKDKIQVDAREIIFFESADGKTWVHTNDEIFAKNARLYELEKSLPHDFVRISKSAIVNVSHIFSIKKNLAGPSEIRFRNSRKRVNLSRSFYKILISKMSKS